jgi:hypothetical protein
MGQPSGVRAPLPSGESIARVEGTVGTETSQYHEEEESSEIPAVVASDPGTAQTRWSSGHLGL